MAESTPEYVPGLAGVPAALTKVCYLDGTIGKLQYRGYPIEMLSESCSFEEVAFLLLFGELPTAAELASFKDELVQKRTLKYRTVDALKTYPPQGHPMDALMASTSALAMLYPGDHVADAAYRRDCAVRLVACFPTLVAAWARIRNGDDPIAPRPDLDHAENFLYMMDGREPLPLFAKVLDVAFILHAEHSMNASTFTARVAGSTLANPFAAIASAVGALGGPLHGGANEDVLRMLGAMPTGTAETVRKWAEDRLARKQKITGFGHREYRVKDPRAGILQKLAVQLFEEHGSTPIYDLAVELEAQMVELVGKKGVYPNVDFYSGIVYQKMGISTDVFTPIFAIARVAGWAAHLLEQLEDNRIFRPNQVWTGVADRAFVPVGERG